MPIPQNSPVSIGPIQYPITQPIIGNPGPYKGSGGKYFIIVTEVTPTPSTESIVAWRSDDGGQTYTVRVSPSIDVYSDNTSCPFYPGTGDTIYVGYMDLADSTLKFTTLDISGNGTWGTPNASAVTITGGGGFIGTLWCCKSGANVYIAWDDGTSPTQVNALVWDGASWSGRVAIANDGGVSSMVTLPITIASSGKAIIRYTKFNAYGSSGSGSIHYVVMNGSMIVSDAAEMTFPDGDLRYGLNGGYQEQFCGWYDAATDSSILPTLILDHSTFDQFVYLLIGSPSAAPVFTTVIAATIPNGDINTPFVGYPCMVGNDAGDSFSVFYTFDIDGGVEHQIEYATAPALTGPWTTPALWYDEDVHPPPGDVVFDGIFPLSASILPDGSTTLVAGFSQGGLEPPPSGWCGVMFVWPLEVAPEPGCPTIYVARQPQPSAPAPPPPPGM